MQQVQFTPAWKKFSLALMAVDRRRDRRRLGKADFGVGVDVSDGGYDPGHSR